jgi:aminoglycoside phosphotransferase (APT) family kinase protein
MVTSQRLAEMRARKALAAAGIDADRPLVPLESATNEVWAAGDVVVRVNRRTQARLRREAALSVALPPEVHYPEVLASGTEAGEDWIVLRRVSGTPLVRAWPSLSQQDRRRAVAEVATALRALHATVEPRHLPPAGETPQLLVAGTRATEPVIAALQRAAKLPHVDARAMATAVEWVQTMRTALDPFDAPTLIHGDLHFQNVLWDGERVTALLDLEFARAAPPDVDLDVLLRFCTAPFLFVPVGREAEAMTEDYADVPFWIRDEYPELFAHPRIFDRLRVYAVGSDVRDLLANPPTRPSNQLTRNHPYRRLMATLRGSGHLDYLAAR